MPADRLDTAAPFAGQHPLNRGLVRRWVALPTLANGPTLADLVTGSRANAGTLASAGWSPSPTFAAVSFNGSSSAVNMGGVSALNLNRTFSLVVRFRLAATGAAYTLACYGNGGFCFRVSSTSKLHFFKSQTADLAYANTTLSAGVWYTGGVTMDASGNGAFYLDGRADGTFSTALTFSGNQQFALGTDYQSSGVGSGWFSGLISDAWVAGRVLSAAEMKAAHLDIAAGSPDTIRRRPSRAVLLTPVSPPPPPPASSFPAAVVGGGYGW